MGSQRTRITLADHTTLPDRPDGPPGRGPRRLDPADKAQLAESPVSWPRVAALFAPYRWPILAVMTLLVISSLVGLATPFLTRIAIDDALPARDLHLLLLVVGAMIAVTVATSVFGVLQTWISTLVGQRVMHALRTDVFTHLQRQSLAFFTRTKGGEVQSRLTNDVNAMQSVVTNTATSIATNITTVAATAIAMAALSWRLSLLSLIVLPPAIWLTRRVALLRRDVTTRQQRQLAELLSQVDEGLTVSGVRLAKTMGAGQAVADRFSVTSRELVDLEVRAQLAGRWRMATMSVIFAVIPALLYLAAGFPATSGGMTIGTLVAFVALQSAVFRPVMGLLNTGVQVVSSMALFSRIFGYLDLPVDVPEPEHPVHVDPMRARGELRFEDVSYRYPGTETEAVRAVTLQVPAGQSLALVGPTGSGKSTLAGLVARLADPTTGRVTIDGIDLRDIAPATLAAMVGVVSQETYLLHDTIAANLRFAKPEAADAELWQALEIAQIDELVAGLPAGLDTVVGSRGQRFSGGEQQRLAIARTVLRDPRIIVLDEATSALDNDTERELQVALDALSDGRTTLTIAHRLSTIRDADQIAVLDHGRIVETGTHTELVERGGRYAQLAATDEFLQVPIAA
jgi:ATP-binding cassette subfamily B protein